LKHLHLKEKEQFKKLFIEENIDNFEDRFKVLEAFLQTERHVTADELTDLINKAGNHIDLDVVRDTLRFMCRFGFASKNRFNKGPIRYEHRHLGQHHDHMVCTKCKKIVEFSEEKIESFQNEIASKYGFHMLQHRMEIYGICLECLKNRVQLMPLSTAKEGEKMVIKEISGGSVSQMRLMSMGLRPGDKVEIITSSGKGKVVVATDCKRYVIGQGLAKKILVHFANELPGI
jgi:Fur family ferric uptake transcriptional regulator